MASDGLIASAAFHFPGHRTIPLAVNHSLAYFIAYKAALNARRRSALWRLS